MLGVVSGAPDPRVTPEAAAVKASLSGTDRGRTYVEARAAGQEAARQELLRRQRVRERFRGLSAAERRAAVDDLLAAELGPSVVALAELRDGVRPARPEVVLKAAQELIARQLGPVAGPSVTVNVDSSLMALARRLDADGLAAVRERAGLPPAGSSG